MAGDYGDHVEENGLMTDGLLHDEGRIVLPAVVMTVAIPVIAATVPVITAIPAFMVEELSSAEISSMLPIEPVAVVFVISTVEVVAAPGRVIVIRVTREIPFGNTELTFYTYLGVGGICYQASGYDHGENK